MLFVIYMSIVSSLSGGSFPGSKYLDRHKLKWLPELLFACGFAFALEGYFFEGATFTGFVFYMGVVAWVYGWMQTGHGTVLPWGDGEAPSDPERQQTLSSVVDCLAKRLRITKFKENGTHCTVAYCRLFMAVKGFLIGLPTGPGALVLSFLWPAAYEIGARLRYKVKFDPNMITELLAGAFAAVVILMFLNGNSEIMVNQ